MPGPWHLQTAGAAIPGLPYFFGKRSADWTTWEIWSVFEGATPDELAPGSLLAGPINLPPPDTIPLLPHVVQMTRTATPNAICLTWTAADTPPPKTWVWDWEDDNLIGPAEFTGKSRAIGAVMSAGKLWWIDKDLTGPVEDHSIGAWRADEDLSNFGIYGTPITPDLPLPPPAITHTPTNAWAAGSFIMAPLRVVTNLGLANAEKVVTWNVASEGAGILSPLTRVNLGAPNTGDHFDAPGVLTNGDGWTTHNSVEVGSGGPWTLPGIVTAAGPASITLTWAGWFRTDAERLRATIDPGTGLATSSLSEVGVADQWSPFSGASEPGWPKTLDLPAGSERWYLFPRL
jgi:hypothetical protein